MCSFLDLSVPLLEGHGVYGGLLPRLEREMALQKKQLPRTVVPEIHDAADGMGCRKNAMRVWETSGIQWGVGKRARAPRSIYIHFILLRMYVCQYDAWKGTLACY